MEKRENHKNHEIRNVLMILSTAMMGAVLLAVALIYFYGPSGRYIAGQALLDPALIKQMDAQMKHPLKGQNSHFVFDHIEFSYLDAQNHQQRKRTISLEDYQKFYALIASEKSLDKVTDPIQNLFFKSVPVTLSIRMRTLENSGQTTAKIFQTVQFIQEDYFRVQLHEKQEQGEWAYFYRPHIYQDVLYLFTPLSL